MRYCVFACTCVRGVFPPLSPYVHVSKFGLPDYCGNALTHKHTRFLSSEASPAAETPHTHTHRQAHTVKVHRIAKLQQTGFLLRSHGSPSSLSLSLSLLPLKLVKAGCFRGSRTAGSECWQPKTNISFILFRLMPASVRVFVTQTSGI